MTGKEPKTTEPGIMHGYALARAARANAKGGDR